MIVTSIFFVANGSSVEYIPPGAQVPHRYESQALCKAALLDLRTTNAIKLEAMESRKSVNAQMRAELDAEIRKAQSMTCEDIEIELPPPVQEAKVSAVPTSTGSRVMWKIGRVDAANVFHGTAYNEYAYDDEPACKAAYASTQNWVFDKAIADGYGNGEATTMLTKFVSTYSCNTVSLKADEVLRQPQVAARAAKQPPAPASPDAQAPYAQPAPEPLPQYPQPQYARSVVSQGYAPSPVLQPGYPIRSIYIFEVVRDAFGASFKFLYPTPYGTVAECWSAVDRLFGSMPSERRGNANCGYAAR
jgi:hypothetical protein